MDFVSKFDFSDFGDSGSTSWIHVAFTCVVALIIFVLFFVFINFGFRKRKSQSASADEKSVKNNAVGFAPSTQKSRLPRSKLKKPSGKKADALAQYAHKWIYAHLKGHSSEVLDCDFSSGGKLLASSDDDGSVVLHSSREFDPLSSSHSFGTSRVSLEYDCARFLRFSPDTKAVVCALDRSNSLCVYKLHKSEKGSYSLAHAENVEFPENLHKHTEVISIGIACTGRFIMSAGADGSVNIYDLHGAILKTIDTHQSPIYDAKISPCGRFVASSGFTPDVKVWAIDFDRHGAFTDAPRAFDLKGHSSGILGFAFNADSSRMITASRDGMWKTWNTAIEFRKGQDAILLQTGSLDALKSANAESTCVILDPAACSFAISVDRTIYCYEFDQGLLAADAVLSDWPAPIRKLAYSSDSQFIAVVLALDRCVRVLHNVSGHRAMMRRYQNELKASKTSEAQKERLSGLVDEYSAKLKTILQRT